MINATTTHRCDGPRCLLSRLDRLAPAEYYSAARTDGVGIRSLGLYEQSVSRKETVILLLSKVSLRHQDFRGLGNILVLSSLLSPLESHSQ